MAGLFMCLGFALGLFGLFGLFGLLGFDIGSQSWLPSLPAEFHLGLLGSLCFQLSSIWDSILASFASFASI